MLANDPTRLASSPIGMTGHAVRLSLSETQSLSGKAARGAGFDWGHAEEAGQAAQWLATRGLPGCDMLLRRLHADVTRAFLLGGVHASDTRRAPLCPLYLGTALADHATLPAVAGQTALELGDVAVPGLLLPFLATVALQSGRPLCCSADGISVNLHADGNPEDDPALAALCNLARAPARVTFPRERVASSLPRRPADALPLVPLDVWRALDILALRVTVPSSARSLSGAGSKGSDND